MARVTSRAAPGPGTQGTMGGPTPIGPRPGRKYPMPVGDELYLWILIGAELMAITVFRNIFSRYHGG